MLFKGCWISITTNLVYLFCCCSTCEKCLVIRGGTVFIWSSHDLGHMSWQMSCPWWQRFITKAAPQVCSADCGEYAWRDGGWEIGVMCCSAGVAEDGGQHMSIKLSLKACRIVPHTALNFCAPFLTKRTSKWILKKNLLLPRENQRRISTQSAFMAHKL